MYRGNTTWKELTLLLLLGLVLRFIQLATVLCMAIIKPCHKVLTELG